MTVEDNKALVRRFCTEVFEDGNLDVIESVTTDDFVQAMADASGDDRPAVAALELTKRFERVHRGTLKSLVAELAAIEEIKGEAVVVVAGAPERDAVAASDWQAALAAAMEEQPLRAAVDEITTAFGLKRKDVYDAALRLKAEKP